MADFLTNLWNGVFEAGPTPTLLIATNATFGALQVVLFALLLATYSIHFVILSLLCAGLWFSINWFASELRAVQAEQHATEKSGDDTDVATDTATTSTDGTTTQPGRQSTATRAVATNDDASFQHRIAGDWEKVEKHD